jgi:hypothetical protein
LKSAPKVNELCARFLAEVATRLAKLNEIQSNPDKKHNGILVVTRCPKESAFQDRSHLKNLKLFASVT